MLKRLIDAREFRMWLALFMAADTGVWIGAHSPVGVAVGLGCMAALFAAGFIAP